jgi:UDP-N-acetylglucosamine--N-acetylmuramyl-(pentapeptide) pyrophosphoryl-undecaprenol N-acetylglucosamine transferase
VIAAGGTGGHFYPGLVLAKTLQERGWQPLMLVKRGDLGLAALEREGVPAVEVDMVGFQRALDARIAVFAWKAAKSVLFLRKLLRDFRPDIVVGMGGYLTGPAAVAAKTGGFPLVVHDSNAVLGQANKLAAKLGAKLFWGLPPKSGGGKVVGTPIRPELWKPAEAKESRKRFALDPAKTTVLVFGGSQGARGLNREAPAALRTAANAAPGKLQVLHLTGDKEHSEVSRAYEGAPLAAKVLPRTDLMAAAYGAADLVVCRSGAGTLAELAAQKKASVLVPFPFAAENHQEANARSFEAAGCARVMLEQDLPANLASLLADLLLSPQGAAERKSMAEAFAKLDLPAPESAAPALADAIEHEATHTGLQR